MRTKLAAELGLEFPIFAFTHCRDVVAAVSNAGGIGVFGVAGHSIDELAIELDWIEKHVGNKPYGVDLLLPVKFVGSDKGGLDIGNLDALIPAAHRVLPGAAARALRRAAASGRRFGARRARRGLREAARRARPVLLAPDRR